MYHLSYEGSVPLSPPVFLHLSFCAARWKPGKVAPSLSGAERHNATAEEVA